MNKIRAGAAAFIGGKLLKNLKPKDPDPAEKFELAGLPIFFEEFTPSGVSLFDTELDEIVKKFALENKTIKGFCNIAAAPSDFVITDPNFRENVFSSVSNSTNRQRTLVCGISMAVFGHPLATLPHITRYINQNGLKVYTAEANSALFTALKQLIKPELFFFSEYFDGKYPSGELVGGIMHQDLQATSFKDATFDLVLTSDVLEHVPDALKAEKEIVRILKPGGTYCFTVPFLPYGDRDKLMATQDEHGKINFLAEPQYHGDPLRSEGSLVFRIFSYNELKSRFENSGCTTHFYRFWSKTLGILDTGNFVHLVTRPS
jgi:SAM-dependent methyltransferase